MLHQEYTTVLVTIITLIQTTTETEPTEESNQYQYRRAPDQTVFPSNVSRMPESTIQELNFNVESFVLAIVNSSKKSIVKKVDEELNSFYDNQTAFVHGCATTQLHEIIEAEKAKRIDKMKSYVDYFYLYKQVYMELLNGFKNMVMNELVKVIKTDIRYKYKAARLKYEEYIDKDRELDEKLVFINKAIRTAVVNHVLNVEVAMFHDFFQNHKIILKDEDQLDKV